MSDLDETIRGIVRDEIGKLSQVKPDEYLSTRSAAALASVAAATIRRWVKDGKLRDHRAGRLVRVSRKDLERLLRDGKPRNDSMTPEQLVKQKYG